MTTNRRIYILCPNCNQDAILTPDGAIAWHEGTKTAMLPAPPASRCAVSGMTEKAADRLVWGK
jgi:hypothetical protein